MVCVERACTLFGSSITLWGALTI